MSVSSTISSPDRDAERLVEQRARRTWVGFVLLLLGGSVGMWLYAAFLAVSDPSMAVVPDYHEKALEWDEHMEAVRASEALGWSVHFLVGTKNGEKGTRALTLFIRDRDAQVVSNAIGHLRLYHHTRGKDPQSIELMESDPGTYVCEVRMDRDGWWQFELSMDWNDRHFEWTQSQDIQLP